MCLMVDKENKVKKLIPDKDGLCKAYKVVMPDNSSIYNSFNVYKIGENSAKGNCKIWGDNNVYEGFHLCVSLERAKEYVQYVTDSRARKGREVVLKIIEVFFNERDVIAYGIDQDTLVPCVTVRSLTVKSLEEIK